MFRYTLFSFTKSRWTDLNAAGLLNIIFLPFNNTDVRQKTAGVWGTFSQKFWTIFPLQVPWVSPLEKPTLTRVTLTWGCQEGHRTSFGRFSKCVVSCIYQCLIPFLLKCKHSHTSLHSGEACGRPPDSLNQSHLNYCACSDPAIASAVQCSCDYPCVLC